MRLSAKHILLAIVLMMGFMTLSSQHRQIVNQYMFNGLLLNPAYAGSKDAMAFNMHARNQWMGFEGSPSSIAISGHSPIKGSKISWGGIIQRNSVGVSSAISAEGMASCRLDIDRGSSIRVGISAGMEMQHALWSQVLTEQSGDYLFSADVTNNWSPIFGFGAYYQSKDWYAGYSIPQLLTYVDTQDGSLAMALDPGMTTHLVTAGYAYRIKRGRVIKPSVLVRAVPNGSFNLDLNATMIFDDGIWAGLSYRTIQSAVAIVEYQVHHQFRIGYSYDYAIGRIGQYFGGSHEVMLLWELRKRSLARSPRYF